MHSSSMNLANWAIVSHKDDTGFGRQAQDLRSVVGVGKQLVIPSERLTDHPLIGPDEVLLDPLYPDDKVKDLLFGLEGIIFSERPSWHPRLLPLARALGVRTVCLPNWEWFNGDDPLWKHCDLFICLSDFALRTVMSYGFSNAVSVLPAIDLSRFPCRRISGPARLFIHNAGLVDHDDRKGTRDTIKAFMKVKLPDIRLIVRMQKEVPLPSTDSRIEIQIGNLANPSDLYAIGDVAVQPSKMEGIGYMVIEPLLSGMPVITLDYPPMNEYVRTPELLVAKRWFARKAFPSRWIKQAHLRLPDINDLATKIAWCAHNDLGNISSTNRHIAETAYAREALRNQWLAVLSSVSPPGKPAQAADSSSR